MTYQRRRLLAWLVLFVLLALCIGYIKFFILPLVTQPLTASLHPQPNMLPFFLVFFGLTGVFMLLMSQGKKTTIAHGSAHFATREELKTYGTLVAHQRRERNTTTKALAHGKVPSSKMHLGRYHKKLIVLDERQQESHVFVFAPTDPHKSHHYNPLVHVHNMDDAEALATCLIDNIGTSREAFWNSAPKLLVASTILHLRAAEPRAPFSRLIDILCGTK